MYTVTVSCPLTPTDDLLYDVFRRLGTDFPELTVRVPDPELRYPLVPRSLLKIRSLSVPRSTLTLSNDDPSHFLTDHLAGTGVSLRQSGTFPVPFCTTETITATYLFTHPFKVSKNSPFSRPEPLTYTPTPCSLCLFLRRQRPNPRSLQWRLDSRVLSSSESTSTTRVIPAHPNSQTLYMTPRHSVYSQIYPCVLLSRGRTTSPKTCPSHLDFLKRTFGSLVRPFRCWNREGRRRPLSVPRTGRQRERK